MTPEDELRSLLRRCHLEPESATPRHVVADWLEENGDGPAEAALASLLRRAADDGWWPTRRWIGLDDDERPVADVFGASWLGPLAGGRDWGLDRGLLTLSCGFDELAAGPPPPIPLRGGIAWLTRLKLEAEGPLAPALASPWLEGLSGTLGLNGAFDCGTLTRAAERAPHLLSLAGLGLDECRVGGDFAALCSLPWECLAGLSINRTGLGEDALHALAGSPMGQSLRQLSAEHLGLIGPGVAALASSGSARSLRTLELDYNDLGLDAVASLGRLSHLRWLSLTANRRMGLPGVEAVCAADYAPGLFYLSLAFLEMGDAMCSLLASAGTLKGLARLDVSGDATMTIHGVRRLVESPGLPALTWLGIPGRLKSDPLPRREGLHIA